MSENNKFTEIMVLPIFLVSRLTDQGWMWSVVGMSFRLEFKFHVIQFHPKDVSRKLYLVYILQRNYVWRSKAPTDIESFSELGDIECREDLFDI